MLGFRAPSFSIIPGYEWALDVLLETGYRYDSSLFPVKRRGYGYPEGSRDPWWIERPAGRLLEVPPATLRRGGFNLPAAGGAYFRLLPYGSSAAPYAMPKPAGVPGTFYIHPWEYDPGQPRVRVPLLTRIRHYGRQGAVFGRLQRLVEGIQLPAHQHARPARGERSLKRRWRSGLVGRRR